MAERERAYRSPQITVTITDDLVTELDSLVEERKERDPFVGRSEVVRELLTSALRERARKRGGQA